jgi:osmotically-inducible protein OsmY
MKKVIYLALLGVAFSQLHGCAAVVVGGAAVGASMATDRRGIGVYVGDQEIESRASYNLTAAFKDKPVSTLRHHQFQPPGADPWSGSG